MKVAITGGAGFLGHHLAIHLQKQGYSILIIDNLSRTNSQSMQLLKQHKIKITRESILSKNLAETLAETRPDVIIHAAALTSVEESLRRPNLYSRINTAGTHRVFEESRKAGVSHFIYISSAAVYGDPEYLPVDESHPLKPKSPYGATKLAGESYASGGSRVKTTALRLFNLYGPRQNPQYAGVIERFMRSIKAGVPPTIFGDGEQTRDFIHVLDVAKAIQKSLETGTEGTFNIGSGKPASINSLAETMLSIAKLDSKPEHAPQRSGEIRESYADIGKAERQLSWKPEISLEDGLAQLIRPNTKTA